MPMYASFVRGDVISVLRTNAHGVADKGLVPGDIVKVGGRKKNGWLRVKCQRTGELVTIRSGRHLCLKSEATRPASQIDLLIRENQVVSAEQRAKVAEAMVKSLTAERDELRSLLTTQSDRVSEYQNLQQDWHDTLEQKARLQVRLEQQLQQLRADSDAAAMAYHARVSELEEQLDKYLRAGEDDWQVEEDDWCHDDCCGSHGDDEPVSNMQAEDPLALGRIGLHPAP